VTHQHRQPLAAATLAAALAALSIPLAALANDDERNAPAPPESVRVAQGEGWKSSPRFTVNWSNPEHRARIEVADYRLCRVEPAGHCDQGRRRADDVKQLELAVPEAGDYTLVVWLGDSHGRSDPHRESDAVHVRFDDQPPTSDGLELGAGGDRASLSLAFEDGLSGPGEAEIQLRPEGGDWQSLPTTVDPGGRAAARIADLELPDGSY
jgi:hypothetical protein